MAAPLAEAEAPHWRLAEVDHRGRPLATNHWVPRHRRLPEGKRRCSAAPRQLGHRLHPDAVWRLCHLHRRASCSGPLSGHSHGRLPRRRTRSEFPPQALQLARAPWVRGPACGPLGALLCRSGDQGRSQERCPLHRRARLHRQSRCRQVLRTVILERDHDLRWWLGRLIREESNQRRSSKSDPEETSPWNGAPKMERCDSKVRYKRWILNDEE